MESSASDSTSIESPQRLRGLLPSSKRVAIALYVLAVAASISTWLLAIRAPLWLDETGSYWQISAGFKGIWSRRFLSLCFPAYSYILWFSTKLLGTSEMAMRIPSFLAMLGAAYVLYLAARELFEWDLSIIAVVIFCLHPIVVYESIDVRPYAFGMLAINAAILVALKLRRNDSIWLAALLGLLSAWVVWFHYLFAAILPALLICFVLPNQSSHRKLWRQMFVTLAAFGVTFMPVVPGLLYLFHTGKTHVFEPAPNVLELIWTLAPLPLPLILFATAIVVAVINRNKAIEKLHFDSWQLIACCSLALIPTLILYVVSIGTPIHLFTARHRLVAIPGIALTWALALRPFRPRAVRLGFCATFVVFAVWIYTISPAFREHYYTWKYAIKAAEKSASADDAPVLICSDWPESNYVPMPLDSAKTSLFFAPLSYYKLTVPVVPLPRELNPESIRVGNAFLVNAGKAHQRFLAMAWVPSYPTLDWIAQHASGRFSVRKLGTYDGVKVLVFTPREASARD